MIRQPGGGVGLAHLFLNAVVQAGYKMNRKILNLFPEGSVCQLLEASFGLHGGCQRGTQTVPV